jgi:hypothetical protein
LEKIQELLAISSTPIVDYGFRLFAKASATAVLAVAVGLGISYS